MMTPNDVNRILILNNDKIAKFAYHKDANNEYFEIEFNSQKKLFVNFAFLRVHNEKELLLSSWESSIGKNYAAIFDDDNMDSLLLCEMPSVDNTLKGRTVVNITISPIGDLHIVLENCIKIDVLINCFCKYGYFYKLEDEIGEIEINFDNIETLKMYKEKN